VIVLIDGNAVAAGIVFGTLLFVVAVLIWRKIL